jgi:hypothetical protein
MKETEIKNYDVMTYGEYLSARIQQPFCLQPDGLLYYEPINVYFSEYGNTEKMDSEMKVYVLKT